MVSILETLADYSAVTKDAGFLTEKARQGLGRQISLQYADDEKMLRVLTIEPGLEQRIVESRAETPSGIMAALEPELQRRWIGAVSQAVKAVQEQGHVAITLCSEAARALVRASTSREIPHLVVLSVPEIDPGISVESLGEIRLEE
jgi:flagellar biosynthesis protein FlhA